MIKHIKSRIDSTTTMNEKQKLKNIPRGETFSRFGREWIVLEHDTNRTLVLAKDTIGNIPFDENNYNNWAKSSLRKYLNGEFLKEMCGKSSAFSQGFRSFTIDLTADDGLKDYGESRDIVSLLTCDLYRKHRDILEPIDAWWWLATPYSTLATYSCCVRRVDSVGMLDASDAFLRHGGVRPICYLNSDLAI